MGHLPLRTCVATREKLPQHQLVRVVVDAAETALRVSAGDDRIVIVPDPDKRLPGRGAWITPDVKACQIAVSRRTFERALKLSCRVDATAVLEYCAAHGDSTPMTHDL